jgi:hypothetical protein
MLQLLKPIDPPPAFRSSRDTSRAHREVSPTPQVTEKLVRQVE